MKKHSTFMTYTYNYSVFILCIQFQVTHTQTTICRSFQQHMKDWAGLIQSVKYIDTKNFNLE